MQLSAIIEEFEEQIASVLLEERFERSLTQKFFEDFVKAEAIRAKNPDASLSSHHAMAYRTANDLYPVFFARKSLNHTEVAQLHKQKKNRKYCWLFVDAYEAMEDFLEKIHANLGITNINNWILSDFGGIRSSEIKEKDYAWFLDQSRKKRDAPNSILSNLRNIVPEFAEQEQKNKAEVNYRFFFHLSRRMRHLIVHNRGIVQDPKVFTAAVFKESGIARTQKLEDAANYFFAKLGDGYQVCFLERLERDCPIGSYHDVLEWATTTLLAHAHLVVDYVRVRGSNT